MEINEQDKELLEKFEKYLQPGLSEQQALEFFCSLKPGEYDRLILFFQKDSSFEIDNDVRDKMLLILNQLKNQIK